MRLFVLLLSALLMYLTQADLPVHCLQSQTVGEWEFIVNQDIYPFNIRDKRVACGNGFPNQYVVFTRRVQKYKKLPKFSFVYEHKWKAQLRADNTVTITTSDKKQLKGKWTMIYDEGFSINVPGYQFLTFFLYLEGKKEHYTRSVCGRTMIGWYNIHSEKKMSCFFGYRTDIDNSKIQIDYSPRVERAQKPDIAKSQTLLAMEGVQDVILAQDGEEKTALKSPPKYTQAQMKKAMDEARKYYNLKAADVPLEELPKQWDWRNVQGVNFVTPVRQQGHCGSCYALSNIEAFEARLRIKNKNLVEPTLSANFLLKCGIYTQGCRGGYSYTAAKFLKDFGVPTEAEVPYKPRSKEDCFKILLKKLDFKKINDFQYLGGEYTKANQDIMIKELRAHGPFAVGILPGHHLKGYKGGIITGKTQSTSLIQETTVNHHSMIDYKKQWEEVEHAVLLVGYGETDQGEKYWILRNSWGTKFGLKGDFLVARGIDALNVESLAVAIHI